MSTFKTVPLFILFLIVVNSNLSFPRNLSFQVGKQDSIQKQIQNCKKELEKNAEDTRLLNQLASLYLQINRTDSAEYWLSKSHKIDKSNPETHFLIGKTFFIQGLSSPVDLQIKLYSKAIRNFRQALELRPDYLKAHYYLGKVYLEKGGNSNYEYARQNFQFIVDHQVNFLDSEYLLGKAFHLLKQVDTAIAVYQSFGAKHPDDARPFIGLFQIYFELDKFDDAYQAYLTGVTNLREPDMLQTLFLETRDILTEKEREAFESLDADKKGNFFKIAWKRRDPTPLTDKNERFNEHYKRLKYAREKYYAVIPPYYDDRGRVYVKYGEPDAICSSLMGGKADLSNSPLESFGGSKTWDNESWSYENSIMPGLVFDFVDKGGSHYKIVQDLTEAGIAGIAHHKNWNTDEAQNSRLALARRLYQHRVIELGGIYTHYFAQSLSSGVGSRSGGLTYHHLNNFVDEKTAVESKVPVAVHRYNYHKILLPFACNFAQFCGREGKTRLEIYRALSTDDVTFIQFVQNRYLANVTTTVLILDSLYDEIDRSYYPREFNFESKEKSRNLIFKDQAAVELWPGKNYHLVIQVENPQGNKMEIKKWQLNIRNFPSDSLAISDIELAVKIEPSSENNQFCKNNLMIVPAVFDDHDLSKQLHIYYEIYNIKKGTDSKTRYQIDYELKLIARETGGFTKFFRNVGKVFGLGGEESITSSYIREGENSEEIEYLSFDVSNIPQGTVQLSVLVKDLLTAQIVQTFRNIKLIKD